MAEELWGTFAVDDHLLPRAYVAEVLLFDRLVIPEPHPNDDEEIRAWETEGWQPERLQHVIRQLGNRAIPVTWDPNLRTAWQTEYDKRPNDRAKERMKIAEVSASDCEHIRRSDDEAKHLTRMVLVGQVRKTRYDWEPDEKDDALVARIRALDLDPAGTIDAVVGYNSYPTFTREVGPVRSDAVGGQPDSLMIGWDFVVPEDTELSNEALLDKALTLSANEEFAASRRDFHEWRRKMIANKADPDKAIKEMDRCLIVFNGIAKKAARNQRMLRAVQCAAAALPLLDFLHPGIGTIAGGAGGIGTVLWADKIFSSPEPKQREKFAALVHDSRRAFDWK